MMLSTYRKWYSGKMLCKAVFQKYACFTIHGTSVVSALNQCIKGTRLMCLIRNIAIKALFNKDSR